MNPRVKGFFHDGTNTVSYVVAEADGPACAIVDPVLDYDPKAGRTATAAADAILAYVRAGNLKVEWILETHAHADHLSAGSYLKEKLGSRIGVGANIVAVQSVFKDLYHLEPSFPADGSQFDRLFEDEARFKLGGLEGRVLWTPGHTPACVTYIFGDAAFVGDTLFMPDFGTARVDFPGGDASVLYDSIHRILALPDETRLFMCHDYGPNGRDYAWETTVAKQRAENIHVGANRSREEFIGFRTERDACLSMPELLLPSIQVNIRAGALPEEESNGISYLKIPLNAV
ncbi:MBL fold metallo-hydrolase [Denitrobaculum tricleocarpae]|uniref:MBL fold metallo-hydrolase n=1 Tax=Denitrobaculum tricleocarpae TaxID=2591009 RepID=A0A545TTD2_9PROT|nr:MBL fold metallo-hydrolase [Denitrobaculum tricleocarpae]TQV80476.1 MBL fold metallo-hydrolase [Denitrobaculum tricleocarpae]